MCLQEPTAVAKPRAGPDLKEGQEEEGHGEALGHEGSGPQGEPWNIGE